MDETYPSKVDWWLGVLLVGTALCGPMCIGAGVLAIGSDNTAAILLIVCGILTLAIFPLLIYPMTYTLTAEGLRVRFGVIKQTIPYGDITHAEPSRNPLSSPALSLDRLEIRFKGKWVLISPKDKDEFMQALARRDPGLVYADGKVTRT